MKQYAPRPSGMILADNTQDPDNSEMVKDQNYHYSRLLDAINTGHFLTVR